MVIITKGFLKGYKGSIIFANESVAEVHVHGKCAKVIVPRQDIFCVYNEMDGIRMQNGSNNVPVHLSFDDAAN